MKEHLRKYCVPFTQTSFCLPVPSLPPFIVGSRGDGIKGSATALAKRSPLTPSPLEPVSSQGERKQNEEIGFYLRLFLFN
jgi:hypothetical protein